MPKMHIVASASVTPMVMLSTSGKGAIVGRGMVFRTVLINTARVND